MPKKFEKLEEEVHVNQADNLVEQSYTYELSDNGEVIDGVRVRVRDLTTKQILFSGPTRRGEFSFTVTFDSTTPHSISIEGTDQAIDITCELDQSRPDVLEIIKQFKKDLVLGSETKNYNVSEILSLTKKEAIEGTVKKLDLHVNGNKEEIRVRIPAGIKNNQKLRLEGKGLTKPDGTRGNFYLQILIFPPQPSTSTQHEDATPDPRTPTICVPPETYRSLSNSAILENIRAQYAGRIETLRYFGLLQGTQKPYYTVEDRVTRKVYAPSPDEIIRIVSGSNRLSNRIRKLDHPTLLLTPMGLEAEEIAEALNAKHGRLIGKENGGTWKNAFNGAIVGSCTHLTYFPKMVHHFHHEGVPKERILAANSRLNHFKGWQVTFVDGKQNAESTDFRILHRKSGFDRLLYGDSESIGSTPYTKIIQRWAALGYTGLTPEEYLMLQAEAVCGPFKNELFSSERREVLIGAFNPHLRGFHPTIKHVHYYGGVIMAWWDSWERQIRTSQMKSDSGGFANTNSSSLRRAVRVLPNV